MKKLFKFIGVVLLVILLIAAAFIFTFDPNNYKQQATKAVKDSTGLQLNIEGDISLSVFPWIGVGIEKVQLLNPQVSNKTPIVKFDDVEVSVKVLPLLSGQLVTDTVRINGLALDVVIDEQGKTNIELPAQKSSSVDSTSKKSPPEKTAKETSSKEGVGLEALAINGVEIINAQVSLDDKKSGQRIKAKDINLNVGAIRFDQPIPVQFSANVNTSQPKADVSLSLETQASMNKALNVFKVADLSLKLKALAPEIIKPEVELEINTQAGVDLKKDRAEISSLLLKVMGVELATSLTVDKLTGNAQVKGKLNTNAIDVKALTQTLGIELPPMQGAKSLSSASVSATFDATPAKASLNDVVIGFDQSQIKGGFQVPSFSPLQLRYNLTLDAIALDDYMPPPVEADEKTAAGSKAKTAKGATGAPAEDIEIALPLELIRSLDVDGTFKALKLSMMGIEATDLTMKTRVLNGVAKVDPLSVKTLNGSINMTATVNAKKDTPAYAVTLDAKNLQAGTIVDPVLEKLSKEQKLTMTGALQMGANINTSGVLLSKLKKNALGNANVDVTQTGIDGLDLDYYIRDAVATFAEKKNYPLDKNYRGTYDAKTKSAFNKFHASFKISDGKAVNNDLILDSNRIQLTGAGHVDIVNNSVDYKPVLDYKVQNPKDTKDKLKDIPLKFHVHGPFDQLAFDFNSSDYGKQAGKVLTGEAKAKVQKKVDAKKEVLKDKSKEKLDESKDKLKNKLKGLFR